MFLQRGLIICLLLFLPWTFSSVDQWAIDLAVAQVILIFLITLTQERDHWRNWFKDWFFYLVIAGFALLIVPYVFLGASVNPPLISKVPSKISEVAWLPSSINNVLALRKIYFWGSCALLCWSVSRSFRTEKAKKLLLWVLFTSALGTLLVGILQRMTNTFKILWIRKIEFAMEYPIFFGPFFNRNHFADYMNMMIPLAFPLARSVIRSRDGDGNDLRLFIGICVATFAFGIIYVKSRGAFAVMVLELLTIVAFSKSVRSGINWKVLVGFGIFIVVTAALGGQGIIDRVATNLTSTDHDNWTRDNRFFIWPNTWEIIKASPAWGWGPGCFAPAFIFMLPKDYHFVREDHAHNDILHTLVEVGFIGTTFFIVVLSVLFVRLIRVYRKMNDPFHRSLVRSVLIIFGGTMLTAQFSFPFQLATPLLTLSALVGLALSSKPLKKYSVD
ncbi:MAG: O-antigen ligase family protein [Verrucomicrobiota bacterium]|nr:O-antigen ligase family protein [Verrucomicrobiota bacterium]